MKKIFTEIDDGLDFSIKHIESGETFYDCESVVDILNELAEEKKELQVQCNLLREQANEFHRGARENANRVRQLEKENKTLKSALKELKEIGDYQEMRIRELSDETNM